jgi:predicted transcriptional regulator
MLIFVMISCNDETQRDAEKQRDAKKKELVFSKISKSWNFNTQPVNATSQSLLSEWTAWRELLTELSQKPQSSIGAFQKKAKTLSSKVAVLSTNIPVRYNKPEIRSRIAVLTTKINALDLYVNLNEIPDQKVTAVISDINLELTALQRQLEEIVRKGMIKREEGESDMIRMLDTSRAIPTVKKDIILPK